MVDRIVEEQHLGGFDDDRGQRQQTVVDQHLHPGAQGLHQDLDDRADRQTGRDSGEQADDAQGEVVHQHLEPGPDSAGDELVELLEQPGGGRADDHRAQEHRDVRADDHAHRGDGTDHRAALAMDHSAAGVADEYREQIGDDRTDHRREGLIGHPPVGDEQGRQQAPGDEGADVRHDHSGELSAEALDAGTEPVALQVLVLLDVWE